MRTAIIEVALLGLVFANDLEFPCYDPGLDYRNQGDVTVCQPRQGRCLKANGNNPNWEKVYDSQNWDPVAGEQQCLNNCLIKLENTGQLTGCEWKGTGGNNGCYRTNSQSLTGHQHSNLHTCWLMSECQMGTTLEIKDITSPEKCQERCLTRTQCMYWTWYDKDSGICFLKNHNAPSVGVDNGNALLISGPRDCGNVLCTGHGDPHMRINDGIASVRFSFFDKAEFIWLHVEGPSIGNPALIVHNRQARDLLNRWQYAANTAVAFKGTWTNNLKIEIYGGNTPKIYINEALKGSGRAAIQDYVANHLPLINGGEFTTSASDKCYKFVFDQGETGKTFLKVCVFPWGINIHWQMNNADYITAHDEGLCTKATKSKPWHRQWKLTCGESMLSQYPAGGCNNDDDEEEDDPDDDCTPATQQLAEDACHACPAVYDPQDCIFDVCSAPDPQAAIDLIPDMCDDDEDDEDCPDGFYTPDWPTSMDLMDECVHHWCTVTYTPVEGCPICGCKPDGECVAGNEISVGNGDGETPGAMSSCHINADDDCNCRELCEDDPNHLGYHYLEDKEGENCCCFTTE